ANQLGGQGLQPVASTIRRAILDRDVLSFDKTAFDDPLAQGRHPLGKCSKARAGEHTDHRQGLLRMRGPRPRYDRTPGQGDDCAPLHSITSSAVASSLSGTVRPSIRAIWALITSSNLVACTTGKSAGLAPLRMRPA